jgi:pimeloyl-ACP methyl ester carboxylesterase
MEDRFVTTTSGRFNAVVGGEGDPLIMVHGYSVELNSWRTWERNIEAFSKNFRVYALDLLGYGKSDRPDPPLTSEGEAVALIQLLDAEKLSRAHFIGLSWGGAIVQQVALDVPGRVKKIVLVDSAFDGSREGLDRLGRLLAPTLIMWDADDVVIPVRGAPKLAKAIPNSRLEILTKKERDPDADPENRHWTQMTHSAQFNRIVTQFLLG